MQSKLSCSLLLGLILLSCQQDKTFKDKFVVFGTIVQIEIAGESKAKAQAAKDLIQQQFDQLHIRWHSWQKGGLLAKINDAIASQKPIKLQPKIIEFLQLNKILSKQSEFRFNPAIGNLVALWGFHDNAKTTMPDHKVIERLIDPPLTMDSIEFINGSLISSDPRVKIDLGGIAKGYAVDLAIKTLQQNQIKNAIVNAGGDLRAIGTKNHQSWNIGIKHPQGGIVGSIKTKGDEAIVSSGNYARAYKIKQFKAHHIINPQTGYPSKGISGVTLIAKTATKADAAATAILVAGLKNWRQVAKMMQIKEVLIVDDKGNILMTLAMQQRVNLTN